MFQILVLNHEKRTYIVMFDFSDLNDLVKLKGLNYYKVFEWFLIPDGILWEQEDFETKYTWNL